MFIYGYYLRLFTMGATRLGDACDYYHSNVMHLNIIEETERHRYRWDDMTNATSIELIISREGNTEYHHTVSEDSQWRIGTTALSPEDADRVWKWYNNAYETALVNENRSRGVRTFFERTILFPRRVALNHTRCQTPIEFVLPDDWAQWVVTRGITLADVDRTALLIKQEGAATLPIPRQEDQ